LFLAVQTRSRYSTVNKAARIISVVASAALSVGDRPGTVERDIATRKTTIRTSTTASNTRPDTVSER
jgi:hypothetical protein